MIPNTELENGKVELIREILDINDMHDIDLLKEYNKELLLYRRYIRRGCLKI